MNILDPAQLEGLAAVDVYLTTLDYQLLCDELDEVLAAYDANMLKMLEAASVLGYAPN